MKINRRLLLAGVAASLLAGPTIAKETVGVDTSYQVPTWTKKYKYNADTKELTLIEDNTDWMSRIGVRCRSDATSILFNPTPIEQMKMCGLEFGE
jgi:hypothetical protein